MHLSQHICVSLKGRVLKLVIWTALVHIPSRHLPPLLGTFATPMPHSCFLLHKEPYHQQISTKSKNTKKKTLIQWFDKLFHHFEQSINQSITHFGTTNYRFPFTTRQIQKCNLKSMYQFSKLINMTTPIFLQSSHWKWNQKWNVWQTSTFFPFRKKENKLMLMGTKPYVWVCSYGFFTL